MKLEWEYVENNHKYNHYHANEVAYRAKVIGGWLVRYDYISTKHNGIEHSHKTITFVPDPNYRWGRVEP